MQVDVKV